MTYPRIGARHDLLDRQERSRDSAAIHALPFERMPRLRARLWACAHKVALLLNLSGTLAGECRGGRQRRDGRTAPGRALATPRAGSRAHRRERIASRGAVGYGDDSGAMARTTFELQPVLESVVESAIRLCQADQGFIFRLEGGRYHLAADFCAPPAFREFQLRNPIPPDRGSLAGRVALERRPIHIPDVLADPEYRWRESIRLGGFRSMLVVPILRDDKATGVFVLWRAEVRPFDDRQIELVIEFADQAGLAIENAQLIAELRESLAGLTATREILQVIGASPSSR